MMDHNKMKDKIISMSKDDSYDNLDVIILSHIHLRKVVVVEKFFYEKCIINCLPHFKCNHIHINNSRLNNEDITIKL